jgi:hypothetical protein
MCNLYSITTNQAAIIALFRVVNRYVGNLAPMPGVFPGRRNRNADAIVLKSIEPPRAQRDCCAAGTHPVVRPWHGS